MGIIPDKYLADLTRTLKNIGKKTGKTGDGQTDGKAEGKEGRKMNGWMALSPMLVFLVIYLVSSLLAGDFYKIPIASAFLLASAYALLITKGETAEERIGKTTRYRQQNDGDAPA